MKEGPKIRGEQAIEARVSVDAEPLREHMRTKHGIVPAPQHGI